VFFFRIIVFDFLGVYRRLKKGFDFDVKIQSNRSNPEAKKGLASGFLRITGINAFDSKVLSILSFFYPLGPLLGHVKLLFV